MSDPETPIQDPGLLRWALGFLLVGMAWGLTNPFIRKAAVSYTPPKRAILEDPRNGIVKLWILKAVFAAWDLLRRPTYAVPFLINLTGSVWFFLLIGGAELSLTVPIVNSLAFLFTVLGDWLADGKKVHRDTWIGMAFVLGGIGLCVHSKQ
ncbi:integral membrane protein [Choiromyces venosus 120613-1]|uniref:Integral membrane protein n=1 Tax=Choiromyces venosus 120613-1 TaxID=1336337 RepID=A0A3N4JMX5_9PEZI|nr:integral membrane protein [Choiromyces venosus 120613-1]